MACDELHPKGGGTFFICNRSQRSARCSVAGCSSRASLQCDFPLAGRKAGKTCDRHLCARHGVRQRTVTRIEAGTAFDDTIDFCPVHAELARADRGTP